MSAQGPQSSLGFIPRPSTFENGQQFPNHFHKTVLYINQHVQDAEPILKLGISFFIRNVANNCKYARMPLSMLQFHTVDVIKRLITVADIINNQNPWANATSCPSFQRPAKIHEVDQPLKDIDALASDIRAHSSSLHHSSAEFQPTIKFENEYVPTEAL